MNLSFSLVQAQWSTGVPFLRLGGSGSDSWPDYYVKTVLLIK